MNNTALIIDDEPDLRELLSMTLGNMKIRCTEAANLSEAKQLLGRGRYDLCLTDMRLPDGDGLDLVEWIQAHDARMPVAVITAHGNVDTAVEALKKGAFDFVSKPVELKRLRDIVRTALALKTPAVRDAEALTGLTGQSADMQRLRQQIAKVARSQAPVLISGESGSGKELAARAIHQLGPRNDAPFIAVNCGAVPTELMESEFFGHRKGSFTGALHDKPGLFQAAEGGTLFLDEIADLPLTMQVKLLRAIQEKAIRPVGHEREMAIDVRILSATHKHLPQEVSEGRFRQDLYYRINVIELTMPSLRQRRDDIPMLAQELLERVAREGHQRAPRLTPAALERLAAYSFPGNVRELENILERAFTLSDGDRIDADDLQLGSRTGLLAPRHDSARPALAQRSIDEYLAHIERQVIEDALMEAGNDTAAAASLGISIRQLRYKLKKLGIG